MPNLFNDFDQSRKWSRRRVIHRGIVSAAAVAGGALLLADSKTAKASGGGRDVLPPGRLLVPFPRNPFGIVSEDSQIYLNLQGDGNLVLYQCSTALWASNTQGIAVASCNMQTDGNLVIYAEAGNAVWASNTSGIYGAYLQVQNDGNLVIYTQNRTPVWATNTRADPGIGCVSES